MNWEFFLDAQPEYGKRVLIRKCGTGKYLVMRLTKLAGMNDELFWVSENDRFIGTNPKDVWLTFPLFEWEK